MFLALEAGHLSGLFYMNYIMFYGDQDHKWNGLRKVPLRKIRTMYRSISAEEAVKVVKNNDRVFVHTAAAAPQELTNALTERAEELRNVEICHLHTEGKATYADPKYAAQKIKNHIAFWKGVEVVEA